jgi:hypothetical protein
VCCRQRVQAFAQRGPGRLRARRCRRTCRARAPGAATPTSTCCAPAARVRRVRSGTAPTSPRHAGNLRSPTPVRCPGRAPNEAAPRRPWRRTGRSAHRAARRKSMKPRRSCATACGCPHRARSLTSSTSTSTRLDARRTRLAWGGATLQSSHAGTSPTGDERHSERQSGPAADSLNESQLAAGRGAFTVGRTSPTSRIETASLFVGATTRLGRHCSFCLNPALRWDHDSVAVALLLLSRRRALNTDETAALRFR